MKTASATAIVVGLLACGCSAERLPTTPNVPPPTANSPTQALRLLEWSWNQADMAHYSTLLPADFVFQFAALDPYGNAYRDHPWNRADESISTANVFHGSAQKPAATQILFALDPNFSVRNDPRPGRSGRWHKVIRSNLTLNLIDADQVRWDVRSVMVFYLVRGDSASLPQDLIDRGVVPDSTLWFLERWEEEEPAPGGRALPAKAPTMGAIKALYR